MDRLEEIKNKKYIPIGMPLDSDTMWSRDDTNWLISEIERLRKDILNAVLKLENPDMGGKNYGEAKRILRKALSEAKEI